MAGEQIRMTPMGGVKAFSCRNCGGQIDLLAPGQSISAACKHCGAVADLTDENFKVLSKHRDALSRAPRFEIGAIADFKGHKWKVIGFMVRRVHEYNFDWEEYLLFNPYYGFRFFAHAYGHWSWIKMVQDNPLGQQMANSIRYGKRDFKFLTAGEAEVVYVLGEFYWQVKVGDKAFTRDLSAPPYLLSVELEAGGMIWSVGEYVEPAAVEVAFGVAPNPKMWRQGVGANQLNPHQVNLKKILPIWIASIVLTIAMFFFFQGTANSKVVLTETYTYPDSMDKVSQPFELGGNLHNVQVDLDALSGLDNHWVEFSGVLHNLETNENYEFTVGAEYYFGYTDGENWTEGSHSADAVLNDVPGGHYEMVTSSLSDTTGSVELKVTRAVPIYTNMLMVLFLLCIAPFTLLILKGAFEKRRNA
jgi:Domain of unknown function (DUF4178)